MKAQLLLEIILTLAAVVVLPLGICLLFEPCYRYYMNSKIDRGLTEDSYLVRGELCLGQCRVLELREKVDLSVIVPAFNEEQRLPQMLEETLSYFKSYAKEHSMSYEILVVDDHSTDDTVEVVSGYVAREIDQAEAMSDCSDGECKTTSTNDMNGSLYTDIRILSLARNHGKGGAIRRGVLLSRGRFVLFADADGATDIHDFGKLFDSLQKTMKPIRGFNDNMGASFGSRAHLEKESVAKRTFVRTLLMKGFHMLVKLMVTDSIKDTQCGFKLFTRPTAKFLFSNLHMEGWSFDIELIFIAEKYGIPLSEVGVRWTEIEGSKLIQSRADLVKAAVFMARDIVCVRMAYLLSIWRVISVPSPLRH